MKLFLSFKKMGAAAVLLLLVFILFITGNARDFFFLPVNEITVQLKNSSVNIPCISSFLFLFFILKWALTMLFWMIYLFTGILILRLLRFQNAQIKLFAYLYLSAFLFSFLLILPGKFLLSYDLAYLLARKIMGIFQSPLVLMAVIPVFKLYEFKEKTTGKSCFF